MGAEASEQLSELIGLALAKNCEEACLTSVEQLNCFLLDRDAGLRGLDVERSTIDRMTDSADVALGLQVVGRGDLGGRNRHA